MTWLSVVILVIAAFAIAGLLYRDRLQYWLVRQGKRRSYHEKPGRP